MKYLVIGAGGTGGAIGGFLARAGKDVTLIARGKHLQKMQEQGLRFETPDGDFTVPVKACTMEDYSDTPDVIFVCVKYYSLEEAIAFIEKCAAPHTVVIPILNIYGTGGRMQEKLQNIRVTDGCIYIVSEIKEPGTILMSARIFRVVYGLRCGTPEDVSRGVMPILEAVREDLEAAGITPLLSAQVEKDTLQKFSFVSPMAAVGSAYNVQAGAVQEKGPLQEKFLALVNEVKSLSDAMNVSLPENIVEINLGLLNSFAPEATTSMHRDIRSGRQSEVDGLICEVVRLGKKYQVSVPNYAEMAQILTSGK